MQCTDADPPREGFLQTLVDENLVGARKPNGCIGARRRLFPPVVESSFKRAEHTRCELALVDEQRKRVLPEKELRIVLRGLAFNGVIERDDPTIRARVPFEKTALAHLSEAEKGQSGQ